MKFGQFARQDHRSRRSKGSGQRSDAVEDAMRRLVEDQCPGQWGQFTQDLRTLPRLGRQKAVEEEVGFAEARRRQRDDRRAGAGQRNDAMARGAHARHQARTRIGYRRCTGIDDQRHRFASRESRHDLFGSALLVVLVCRQQTRTRSVMLQQGRAVARVLGGHPGHPAQNLDRPRRHVAEMAERGGNHI